MAVGGGGNGTEGIYCRAPGPIILTVYTTGWGQFIAQYLTLPVSNEAVAGTSARSFVFTNIINQVKSGDFVGRCLQAASSVLPVAGTLHCSH